MRGRGPGICRRLALRRTNCWDGDNERGIDIDDFDFDDIDGQGTYPIIVQIYIKHTQAHKMGLKLHTSIPRPQNQSGLTCKIILS